MSAVILIELLMLTMTLHVLMYSGFTKSQKIWYILTFVSVMVCTLAEYFVHCGYYDKSFKIPLTIITVIQFSISPLLAVFFSGALGLHRESRIASLFFLSNILVEIILAPFGLVFYFNDDGYFRGNLFIIYEVYYFIGLAYLIISMIVVGKRFRHRDMWTIIMVLVMLVGGILPMTFWQIHTAYMSIGMCACLCYIYYNDLVQDDIHTALINNEKKLLNMQEHIISGLANLIESRDTDTGEHITRTSKYVKAIAEGAKAIGLYSNEIDDHFISLINTLAPMHDVGKILVSDNILRKPGRLTKEEFDEMKVHAASGGDVVRKMLSGITDEEYLKFASDIATYHHEWWDGTGYPNKLKGTDIPLCARIMAIADVFDALISKRCYKDAMPVEDAIEIIKKESGTHFDPKLVDVFIKYIENEKM
ncbi:MAG: HD domain-containing protein [Acholeplasmatales bacterium]|nr:HD domain-containing protein [Acholeplasmatales bacterium]